MIGWRSKTPTPGDDKQKGFDDFEVRMGDLMRGERATLGKSLLDVQRELKIKATYISAIENADVSAFETQAFVAGYVRSYSRYLGLDPDETFAQFCKEANFKVAHGMSAAASTATVSGVRNRAAQVDARDPLANPNASFVPRAEPAFSRIEPGAVGSVVVLLALIAALGYGGWSVLQEVQRVQLAPVDQPPSVVAEIDPLGNVKGEAPLVRSAPEQSGIEQAASADEALNRLYRPAALDVPVLTSRDGPIAAINPRDAGVLAISEVAAAEPDPSDLQVVAQANPGVEVFAVRSSWVRVSAADGTVLFEKILDAGERYVVPALEAAPVLRSGNSGSIYFAVNGKTYGPAAPGAQVIKNIALTPESLTTAYAEADLTGDADLAKFITLEAALPSE
jgi:cytoskeletal protein RodZ